MDINNGLSDKIGDFDFFENDAYIQREISNTKYRLDHLLKKSNVAFVNNIA